MNASNLYYPLSALINMVTSLVLAAAIIRTDRKSKLYRSYTYFCFSVACWSFFYFLWQIQADYKWALFFARCLMFGAIFIPYFYFHHVALFLGEKSKLRLFIKAGYLLSMIALAICFTPLFVNDVIAVPGFRYWPIAGQLFLPFLVLWFLYVIAGVILIYNSYRHSAGVRRNQLKYVLLATVIGWSGGATNYPLWFGINIPPVGNILVAVYISIVAYAIVRHRLMDIEVVIRRTAVFAGLFAFVYGLFAIVTVMSQSLFRDIAGWNQWHSLIPAVMIITFALRPLELFLTNATEKYLFQKKYDYRHLLKTFTNEVLTVLDLQQLPNQTIAGLIRILKLESSTILLHNKAQMKYQVVAQIGAREPMVEFFEGDLLVGYLKAVGGAIVKDKVAEKMANDSVLKENFQQLNAQICLPIAMHDDLIGILALGMKKSGEDFTQEDIDILGALARTLAIAISNAQLFDELSKTQAEAAQREKMAVIGTLAAGINHEICNPLGIVRGQCEMFLLNQRDGFYAGKSSDEILKISTDIMGKVIKETDRATAITKKLSSFAKPSKKSDFEEVQVEKEVDEVMGLLGHDLELSNIELQKDFPSDYPMIFADRKQIQEVLFNIIRNAAQAMDKKQGHITVSGFTNNGSATVRIADNGSGIPADKIEQIFHPFYTTKAPGKGTGLGLFIVKQVVERNKGTISVESQVGVGTTFTLKFPAGVQAALRG